jgi:peptidoglycan/LPS O-acetylase OafA/YrhL
MAGGTLQYRREIDGLRAVAVLAVVAFHASPGRLPGGFVGVDIFFVISGFLISGIILGQLKGGTFSFAAFYAARVRRIFPALIIVLLGCFAVGWVVLLGNEYKALGKNIVAGALFFSNFALWAESGYFDSAASTKPLLHLWSLGVEEQFYLVWPPILWFVWRRTNVAMVTFFVCTASFTLNVMLLKDHAVADFYSPLTRFWELMLGALIAMLAPADASGDVGRPLFEIAGVAGLLLIFTSFFSISASHFPGLAALMPTTGGALVLIAGTRSTVVRIILGNRIFVGIGLISYPLYLWHWPLLSYAIIIEGHVPSSVLRSSLVAVAFLLAWGTYELIEIPVRFGSWRRYSVSISCASMLAVGLGGVVTFASHGLLFRFPKDVQALADYQYDFRTDAQAGKCWISATDPIDGFASSCFQTRKPNLLVWGDSFAARFFPGVTSVFGGRYSISQLTRDGCPPVQGVGYERCIESNRFVLSEIRRSPPDAVLLTASWLSAEVHWDDGGVEDHISATISDLKRAGVSRIIVVGPPPEWIEPLPKIVYKAWADDWRHALPKRLNAGLIQDNASIDNKLRSLAQTIPGIEYFSLRDVLCNSDGCLSYAPGTDTLTSWDIGHITTPAAVMAAKQLKGLGLLSARVQ